MEARRQGVGPGEDGHPVRDEKVLFLACPDLTVPTAHTLYVCAGQGQEGREPGQGISCVSIALADVVPRGTGSGQKGPGQSSGQSGR
jgi:hypothetical protein